MRPAIDTAETLISAFRFAAVVKLGTLKRFLRCIRYRRNLLCENSGKSQELIYDETGEPSDCTGGRHIPKALATYGLERRFYKNLK